MLARMARHAGLMNEMSRRASFDFGREILDGHLAPETFRAAVLTCIHCPSVAACRELLGKEGAGNIAVPEFCANKVFFERCEQIGRGYAVCWRGDVSDHRSVVSD